jgi:transposase
VKRLGHQVIVANARKVRAIWENKSKSDRLDAEMLANLGYSNPKLMDRS